MSASVLAAKAKAFDDGMVAAVELLVQNEGGKLATLEALRAVHPLMAAACELGGGTPMSDADRAARALRDEFLANPLASKPLGFYDWSESLTRIFRQDRLLQRTYDNEQELLPIARALHANRDARHAYERALRIAERLTNPLARSDLRPLLTALDTSAPMPRMPALSFLPPSTSYEAELVKKLYGNRPIPDGFNLATELMNAIRERRVDVTPTDQSGFYARQVWSLETLAASDRGEERARVYFTHEYAEHLEALFRGLIALARETHVKQLDVTMAGCAMPRPPVKKKLYVAPKLTVEPLITHYARRAEGYRFVRSILEAELGRDALRGAHRLTAEGPVAMTLDDELTFIERLFDGAAQRARAELGLALPTNAAAEEMFAGFAASQNEDPDIGRDVRMMVPVFFDVARQKVKVWVFMGWSERRFNATWAEPPVHEFVNPADAEAYEIDWSACTGRIATPVTAEVYTSRLMNRAELRAFCDEYATRDAIVRGLERA